MDHNDEELNELSRKVEAMRVLLTLWNPTGEDVWDHPLMAAVGETEDDYDQIDDQTETLSEYFDDSYDDIEGDED